MLNSFWGKFCQRSNLGTVKYCTDPAEFLEIANSDEVIMKDVNVISDNMVRVRYVQEDLYVENLSNVNVVIGAFTTAYARLTLYSYLEKLQERVLYFDTGIVYIFLNVSLN